MAYLRMYQNHMNDKNKCYFDQDYKCTALNVKDCEKCSFRKTKTEYFEAQKKSKERLERIGRIDVDDG